jgi:hypothetical protein
MKPEFGESIRKHASAATRPARSVSAMAVSAPWTIRDRYFLGRRQLGTVKRTMEVRARNG